MYYLRQENMVGFDVSELKKMYKDKISNKLDKSLLSLLLISSIDKEYMNKITDMMVPKDKETIEIFLAFDVFSIFYEKNCKIFFVLKDNFNLKKNLINSLEDLKKAVKENDLTDFAIMSDSGLRKFQLKQYKGLLETDKLFASIKRNLLHYCNDLGSVNLLILLQGTGGDFMNIDNIDFEIINKKILALETKGIGEVLISYNEENKFQVINCVYPELSTCKKNFTKEYLSGEL